MLTLIAKKVNKILLIISIFILFGIECYAEIPKPTSEFYANDFANVLTSDTENYIIEKNKDLQEKTGAQIVVVTVNDLDGEEIEEYANKLFREYGIGDKQKNNGLLLLCSTDERMFRIEVGYGLEGCLPDGKTGRIQDEYIIPYLKENNYDEGIRNGFTACLQVIADEYQITIDTEDVKRVNNNEEKNKIDIIDIIITIIILIFIFRGFFRGGFWGFSGFGGFRRIRRRYFWRRLFWRRRLFGRRRKLTKILEVLEIPEELI